MSISIPGAVFSSLIFHLKNSPSDAVSSLYPRPPPSSPQPLVNSSIRLAFCVHIQEGFLYGSVRTHHVESITDSQSSGTREEKRLCNDIAAVAGVYMILTVGMFICRCGVVCLLL